MSLDNTILADAGSWMEELAEQSGAENSAKLIRLEEEPRG